MSETATPIPPATAQPSPQLQVPFSVVLAEKALPLGRLLELRVGAVLDLGQRHDAPLTAAVNGSPIGKGRAVDIGERLGFRLDSIRIPGSSPRGPSTS